MAGTEDAATVLELFIHDVANLPAELQHYFEEAQAKQEQINEFQRLINQRDNQLQKFIKQNGSLVVNPKEEQYNKTISESYDQIKALQDEKVMLVERAGSLLDRYVKRLDRKISDLQNEGLMPLDPQMPSILKESPGNLVPPTSNSGTGTNTPLQPLSVNATSGGTANLAHQAIARLARATADGRMSLTSHSSLQNHPIMHNSSHILNAPSVAAINLNRSSREMSVGSEKRRRLNTNLGSLPAQPSNLARQSSLGPGTPKVGTPGGSRAGSLGPRPVKKMAAATKKVMATSSAGLARKKLTKGGLPKKSARRIIGMSRASPSTTGDDSGGSDGSDEENMSGTGAADEDADMDDVAEDDTKYCYCGEVSYGDMVACDNADCKGQWFHWKCAGITTEPEGEWLCRDCEKLPKSKIKRA